MRDGTALIRSMVRSTYFVRKERTGSRAVWFDGTGVCLFAETLEETQFCWPRIGPTTVQLNHAQLLALVDGLD